MATIRKRGSRYNVQIRKEGYPSITKTFASISVAKKWAKGVEADMARTRRIEAGEKERLLQGANPELHRIISLSLETGTRRGEILSIKKSHINFPKSVLFIPSTKSDQPRTISLQVRL